MSGSRRSTPPGRIAAETLRDHGTLRDHADAERIDRVWERLEPKLTLGRTPQQRAAKRRAASGWPLAAAALAAGFAMGIGAAQWHAGQWHAGQWHAGDGDVVQGVGPDFSGVERPLRVFAAGATQRSYALPGGGRITLEPGTIVDTIGRNGDALTLRLVRGDATLASPSHAGSVELMVGSAHVTTAAGAHMQIRRDGDHAYLELFKGSAEVTAPNRDNEMVASRLARNDVRRVRIRMTNASLPIRQQHASATPPHPEDEAETDEADDALDDEPATIPAWVTACQEKDDVRTLQLLQQEPGALANVTNPLVLACVARGQHLTGNEGAAIASYERIMSQPDTLRAFNAARSVQRIVRRRLAAATTDGERQKYAAKLQIYAQQERQLALAAVSKGIVLTPFIGAEGMCRRIQAEAGRAKPNWEAVANLGAQYKKAFPTGKCTGTINGILAQRPAPKDDAEGGASSEASSSDANGSKAGGRSPGSRDARDDDSPYEGADD